MRGLSPLRKLWIRLGAVIEITDAEEQAIFGDDGVQMGNALRFAIADGRFCPDGKTYIPCEIVREFNRAYGTSHEEGSRCCDL